MSKGKWWSEDEIRDFLEMVGRGVPCRLIARKMGKSEGAIRAKGVVLRVSLKKSYVSRYDGFSEPQIFQKREK